MENIIPTVAQNTDKTAEKTVTDLKLLKMLIEESVGNTISADTSSEPTRFIANTIITAITIARKRLYASVFMPTALAKD
jgi:hypothetical protein